MLGGQERPRVIPQAETDVQGNDEVKSQSGDGDDDEGEDKGCRSRHGQRTRERN